MKHIYIIVSKTGSIVSRIIGRVTGDQYTHASISLDKDLNSMYSFGRIYTNNPVIGGFVKETPEVGAMKKFRMANIVIIEVPIDDEKFEQITAHINAMYADRKKYHYNYIGLFLAKFGRFYKRERYFYCSEFVKDVLVRFHVVEKNLFAEAVRPIEFLNVKGDVVYQGRLCEYAGT